MYKLFFLNFGKFIIILTLLSAGCSVNDSEPVYITATNIGKGDLTGSEGIPQQNIVVSDTASWNALKNKMDSVNNVSGSFTETEIDFGNYITLAAFSEHKPISGCSIEIVRIEETSDNVIVKIENTVPTTGPAVETQPYHIVKIPKTVKQILFN